MEYEKFDIIGPILIRPQILNDNRGFFLETFKDSWFKKNISNQTFLQDNQSFSKFKGTIRGLHYQKKPFDQGKLIRCVSGEIFDVAVDVRSNSPSFGKYISVVLNSEKQEQLWIPPGFLHGFCTLKDNTIVEYKVTNEYNHQSDAGIAFDDETIAINWPIEINNAIISEKDKKLPKLEGYIE